MGSSADGYPWLRLGILTASFLSFNRDLNENSDEGLVYTGSWESQTADRNTATKIITQGTFYVSDSW